MKPIVLIVHDEKVVRHTLSRLLSDEFQVIELQTADDMKLEIKRLVDQSMRPAVVVIDLHLGGTFEGTRAVDFVQSYAIPVVCVTHTWNDVRIARIGISPKPALDAVREFARQSASTVTA